MAPLHLKFVPNPPEHPFAEDWFAFTICLQDDNGELHGGTAVGLSLDLHFEDQSAAPAGALEVEGKVGVGKNGVCEGRARLMKSSMDLDNRRVVLRARGTAAGKAVEAWSTPMRAMRYRLAIEDDGILDFDDYETKRSKDHAAVWYKDEGGREKCIQLNVRLEDAAGEPVADRPVKLKVILKYAESDIAVTNQAVLKVWTDTAGFADPPRGGTGLGLELAGGVAHVKARVEDVSKNHQGQSFKIEVAPDLDESPTDCDVAAALSKAINVRSKRNKRRRAEEKAKKERDAPSRSPPPRASARAAAAPSPPPPASSGIELDAGAPGVAGWVEAALAGLEQMEWRLAGYEPTPAGQADHTRPLYVFSNPNATIDALRRRYERDVAPHLGSGAASGRKRRRDDDAPGLRRSARKAPAPPALARQRTSATTAMDILNQYEGGGGLSSLGDAAASVTSFADAPTDMGPPDPILPRPMLGDRGVSSLYVGGPAGDGSGAPEAGLPPPAFFAETEASKAAEATVAVVLAKRFRPVRAGAAPLGFPAYDADRQLVGLYREQTVGPGDPNTKVVFVPAADADLRDGDKAAAEKAYAHEVAARSKCVHALDDFGTLAKLKDAAFVYSWSKEPFAELEGFD